MGCLISFNTNNLQSIQTDILVIGSGVAGLMAAIEAAKYGKVLIITKDNLRECNTEIAQGGIAAVLSTNDSYSAHIQNTLTVGDGLCNEEAVKVLVEEGPSRVRELIEFGANFDKEKGQFLFTQEGGHSTRRIIHAKGDATGTEVEETLIAKAQLQENIRILEHTFTIDLLCEDNVCYGALVQLKDKRWVIFAQQTIIATGGIGQIYRETTNSITATGDGMAFAYRAGATLMDMEFIQFHPTTLYIAGASRALISEAVRGEGGILKNKYGERFMLKYHPSLELAPRDVVSRSIITELKLTDDSHVYLDMTHLDKKLLENRFPNIMRVCLSFGLDIRKDLIPVRPTAHYTIGGIKTDINGQTTIDRLYACGETACVGVHGANRLASNSLLEGLVFGYRVGHSAGTATNKIESFPNISNTIDDRYIEELNIEDVRNSLKSLMWRDVGIERERDKLLAGQKEIDFWSSYVLRKESTTQAGFELQNLLTIARLILQSALRREESRGVHYRKDFPQKNDVEFKRHIELGIRKH
ncbi:MAG: L-aspartate oxidase [bacterium]|nr:L-aspartate oxidase [bacterium]